MDSNEIRVGKISSVDYPSGTVRVVYEDQDDAVTRPIPLLSFEYLMPEVDDMFCTFPTVQKQALSLGVPGQISEFRRRTGKAYTEKISTMRSEKHFFGLAKRTAKP